MAALAMTTALAPLRAQGRPATQATAASARQIEARHQIEAFETVLENAVGYAAQKLIQHRQVSPSPSNTGVEVLLTGQTSARGIRLDGYGAVFDVEFPSIRRTVAWTMRTLEREDQIKAASTATVSPAGARMTPTPPAEDPRVFYATELTSALVAALLDQGGTVGIGPDEWLTVAARESLDLRFVPDDPATTLMMRVKGSDLAALRDKGLTREELAKRIEVTQY
jgi:hypothetical protein